MNRRKAPIFPPSIWADTCRFPSPSFRCLEGDLACHVAIVGGGFTGLSAAHHLAEAGVNCIVVEAADIGWGATGRTAGMAGTRYKKTYPELAERYGVDEARRLHTLVHEALAILESIGACYGVEDALTRCGQMIPAHTQKALDALGADVEWLRREAGDRTPELLDREATARALGTSAYCGAWHDPRGGAVHPLNLARGVAQGLARRGVPILTASLVERIEERSDAVILHGTSGTIRADRAILATNAYTPRGLTAVDLSRRVVPVSSSIVVTEPLSENVARTVLPSGRVASDTKRLLRAFRMLPGNRLLFGGRAEITGRWAHDPASYSILERALGETFPQIEPCISHRWSGYVAVSLDNFPHVAAVSERIVYAMGYSGRGVALSHLLGKLAALLARGHHVDAGPMGGANFRRWPFHALRVPAMRLVASVYDARDRWESRRASGG